MKVRFLKTRRVQDTEGFTFEAGEVYDLAPDSAQRWIRRGVAEPVPEVDDAGDEIDAARRVLSDIGASGSIGPCGGPPVSPATQPSANGKPAKPSKPKTAPKKG